MYRSYWSIWVVGCMASAVHAQVVSHVGSDAVASVFRQPSPDASQTIYVNTSSAVSAPAKTSTTPCCSQGHHRQACRCRGRHLRRKPVFWGSLGYFTPVPFGASVRSAMQLHIEQGNVDQLVLYRFDFHPEGTANGNTLNSAGKNRLRKMASLIAESGLSLIVEPSRQGAELDQARQASVQDELARLLGGPVPAEQVVVAMPQTRGTSGTESIITYANRMKRNGSERIITPSAGSFRPGRN